MPLSRPIKRSEISRPSPYNTTVIEGLRRDRSPIPAAPRGAACQSARTRDLFFIADGTSDHAVTETYDQHQKNVAKLRDREADRNVAVGLRMMRRRRRRGAAGQHQSDSNYETRSAEEARSSEDRASAAGRSAIDHHAAGGSAMSATGT